MKKVLIALGTCDRFDYCEEHCLSKIFAQTYKDFDVLIVDNSEGINHEMELRSKFPHTKIVHLNRPPIFREATKQVRQFIVDYAVSNGYEFLFLVDIDFIIPLDTLEKLIKHDVDFVTAAIGYMHQAYSTCLVQNFESKSISKVPGFPVLKPIMWAQMKEPPLFMEIMACGLACALIKCQVLPGIKFRVSHKQMAFLEDLLFCADLQKRNVKLFLDKTIETIHVHVKIEERNWRKL